MVKTPKVRFIPLAEMAQKWNYSEDEMIQLAIKKEFNLFCLKAIPSYGKPLRMPFYIQVGELYDFLPGRTSISCTQFDFKTSDFVEGTFVEISPEDRVFAEMNSIGVTEASRLSVTVNRTDLFLHMNEIAEMERKYPELIQRQPKPQTCLTAETSNRAGQRKEALNASSASVPDNPHPSDDTSEVVSLLSSRGAPVSTLEGQSTPPNKREPSKQSKKDRARLDQTNIVEHDEALVQRKAEKVTLHEQPPISESGYLRLKQIIGDKKEGIPPIIPVSRSSWYAGINSGKYPAPLKLGPRSTAWRVSDIRALQKDLEQVVKIIDPEEEPQSE